MGDKSQIEWTDATWNPVTGCTKVSQGCKHCYAERIFSRPYPGRKFTDVRTHPDRLEQPLRWRKPRRIFVNSMSDLFHEDVPDEFIDEVFAVMGACEDQERGHVFQVLTKRPERMRDYMRSRGHEAWNRRRLATEAYPPRNVWLGVSVEDQETADERIPLLLETPAAVRFLSCEPLLGPVDLQCTPRPPSWPATIDDITDGIDPLRYQNGATIDWVIAGGESGPKARPSHPDWFRSIRDQCVAAGVAYFFKQWGEWFPGEIDNPSDGRGWIVYPDIEHDPAADNWGDYRAAYQRVNDAGMLRVGKKRAGRLLDGRTWEEYPQ